MTVHLIFDDKVQDLVIKDSSALIFVNLLKEEGFKEMVISSEGELSVVLIADDIANHLKENNEVFLIQKGLTMTPEPRHKYK